MLPLRLRSLYDQAQQQSPPEPRTRLQNHPTLLFSWWCTLSALTIILFRLGGRLVRTDRLFREDKIMAWSIVPLFVRMALVHVILLYGTNNVDLASMPPAQAHHRSIGARLVLASRIFYAMFIWTAKFTVSEFLKRMTERFWKKSYERVLRGIRVFLVLSFLAVVIATLAECQPFDQYWQVVPPPAPQCRLGYGNLITMGVLDIVTDLLLVCFPIPVILRSAMPIRRKISLSLLFSMSIILIGVTCARVPSVIDKGGRQQYRSVFASAEILAAAAISNAIILGSFLRDRGIKKMRKYKFGSVTDSMERTSTRRPTYTAQQWGSDEDLIRDMGYRLDPALQIPRRGPRPAPMASPSPAAEAPFANTDWHFPPKYPTDASARPNDRRLGRSGSRSDADADDDLDDDDDDEPAPSPHEIRPSPARRNVAFFDVGGLLEEGGTAPSSTRHILSSPSNTVNAHDFAPRSPRAFLADLSELLTPSRSWSGSGRLGQHLRPLRPSPRRGEEEEEVDGYEMTATMPRDRRSNGNGLNISGMTPDLSRSESTRSLRDSAGCAKKSGSSRQSREHEQTRAPVGDGSSSEAESEDEADLRDPVGSRDIP